MGDEKPFSFNAAADAQRKAQLNAAEAARFASSGRIVDTWTPDISCLSNPDVALSTSLSGAGWSRQGDIVSFWATFFVSSVDPTAGDGPWRMNLPVPVVATAFDVIPIATISAGAPDYTVRHGVVVPSLPTVMLLNGHSNHLPVDWEFLSTYLYIQGSYPAQTGYFQ